MEGWSRESSFQHGRKPAFGLPSEVFPEARTFHVSVCHPTPGRVLRRLGRCANRQLRATGTPGPASRTGSAGGSGTLPNREPSGVFPLEADADQSKRIRFSAMFLETDRWSNFTRDDERGLRKVGRPLSPSGRPLSPLGRPLSPTNGPLILQNEASPQQKDPSPHQNEASPRQNEASPRRGDPSSRWGDPSPRLPELPASFRRVHQLRSRFGRSAAGWRWAVAAWTGSLGGAAGSLSSFPCTSSTKEHSSFSEGSHPAAELCLQEWDEVSKDFFKEKRT